MTSTTQKYFNLLCELRRLYKIEIVTEEKEDDPVLNFDMPTREESARYLDFLRDELAIYSKATIEKLHLDKIILCKKLVKLKHHAYGCASMSLFPDSLPMRMLFRKNTIYLAIEHGNTIDGRITVHHELFHAIEAHDKHWPKYVDPYWPHLNPPAFRYKDQVSVSEAEKYPLNCEGFLSEISMEAIREDKAELFAHLIVNHAQVMKFAVTDRCLLSKVQRMKHLVGEFSADCDKSFWMQREEYSLNGANKMEYEQLLLRRLQ